jgi:hypothetical protein
MKAFVCDDEAIANDYALALAIDVGRFVVPELGLIKAQNGSG